jgi:methylated-DNA-[protein]-cysteine S-methyltransferase
MKADMNYQAKLATPFAVLGIRSDGARLSGIDFLPLEEATLAPADGFTRRVADQIAAYLRNADFLFDLTLDLAGTAHQRKVWRVLATIPRGEVKTYGDIAKMIGSSPRAVGQACGANPVPIIIPCHRVVSKQGAGGFMHQSGGQALTIKHWLLQHERCAA